MQENWEEAVLLCLVTQLCPSLCDPMDRSPPGSSVHGILQARILEWVACPPPGDLPNTGIEPRSPALRADSLPSEPFGRGYIFLKGISPEYSLEGLMLKLKLQYLGHLM